MPYALFENDDQLSRSFATKAEAWQHADDAGLVSDDHGRPTLEDNYVIKPCPETPVDKISNDKSSGDKTNGENWQLPKPKMLG